MLKDFFVKNILPAIKTWLGDEFDEFKAEVKTEFKEDLPVIIAAVREEFAEQLPIIVHTIVTSFAEAAGHLVVNEANKVTSIIPGTVDDDIVNGIMGSIFGKLGIKLP